MEMPATTWNDHLKKCAREWHEMKKEKAEKAQKKEAQPKPPPKVPKRIRGKQTDSQNDLN